MKKMFQKLRKIDRNYKNHGKTKIVGRFKIKIVSLSIHHFPTISRIWLMSYICSLKEKDNLQTVYKWRTLILLFHLVYNLTSWREERVSVDIL